MSVTQVDWQVPPQQVWLAPQVWPPQVHDPFMQVPPEPQACPQVPQLKASVIRLLQPELPQQDCPVPHTVPDGKQPQLPLRHSCPDGQALPQSPQLSGSSVMSMHFDPQHLPPHWSG